MDIVEVQRSGAGDPGPTGSTGPTATGWGVPALGGAAAYWLTNAAISVTPVAAGYRSALSIPYVPMLLGRRSAGWSSRARWP